MRKDGIDALRGVVDASMDEYGQRRRDLLQADVDAVAVAQIAGANRAQHRNESRRRCLNDDVLAVGDGQRERKIALIVGDER